MSLDGVIVLDKPAGMTSAAVVAKVKRALGAKRVGHTGTLDPMATGVLPLCLGEATKIAGYLLAEDKTYEAEIALGVQTDTLDAEGTITATDMSAARQIERARLEEVMASFVGPGMQVPPMFSALKHRGKRLHELARAGQTVERPPRPITIYTLDLLSFTPAPADDESPRARFVAHCSKGTYIRSLAADIGQALGCGAHLTALRRLRSGAFELATAVELAGITKESVEHRLISLAAALAHLPALEVPTKLVPKVTNGLILGWSRLAGARPQPDLDTVSRLLTADGRLLALAVVDNQGQVRYRRVFKRS